MSFSKNCIERSEDMDKREKRFALFLILLVLSAYIVPYTLLSDVNEWYGSFLYWSLFAIVIIITNVLITKKWSD